jgi:hypothetical protein
LCRSPGLSAGSILGHGPHAISPSVRPMTPVASPSHLYYLAGTMAPGPVLTPLLTGVNPDIYLYRHGMDRGIFTNDQNFQADSSGSSWWPPSSLHFSSPPTSCTYYVNR